MKHYVMDYETLSNCFLGVFEHYKKKETKVFTIGVLRNDLDKLLEFFDDNIKYNQWHISFNGLAFDAQITHYILANREYFKTLDGEEIAEQIYAEAQSVIQKQINREYLTYYEKSMSIKQIDVFKLNHWDNAAKRSSLKWIQCSMRWNNVQEMPIEHTEKVTTVEQLQEISRYCKNDVASTKRIMDLSSKLISLRGALTNEYKVSLYSASETKISKEIFLHFLEKKTGISKYELKQLKTYRSRILIKPLILDYIEFKTPEFQNLYKTFAKLDLDAMNLKGQFKASVDYRGVKTHFGLGGVHGAKRGVYEPEEHMTIMSSDVKSFYPFLAINNGWSPGHISSDAFCEQYEWFYNERVKIPKSDPRNYVYKIVLNATYGLSNEKSSFLYDPEFTMRVTVNGQLSLMMLYEMLIENITGSIPIMQNTDGVEIMIPTKHRDKYLEICKEWEDKTKLQLEHDEYQKLIVPDVNSYIGIFKDVEIDKDTFYRKQKDNPDNLYKRKAGKYYMAKTKSKGRFEIDKALHKNCGFKVVSKALYYFFIYGIDPKEYLKRNKNILDYCGQTRARGDWKFRHTYVEKGEVIVEDLQKTLRYYISSIGTKVIKHNKEDNRDINVEAGKWLQTIFNQHIDKDWEEYNIDTKFYLDKINREILALKPEIFANQIKLF